MTETYADNPGYLLIDREHHVPLAIKYGSLAEAEAALLDDPFVDGYCEEDCLDAWVPKRISDVELREREIVRKTDKVDIPNSPFSLQHYEVLQEAPDADG